MVNMGKNKEKNQSLLFRPVGPWKRAKLWVKSGENKMFFKFREKFILGFPKYDKYGKNNEKIPIYYFGPLACGNGPKHG